MFLKARNLKFGFTFVVLWLFRCKILFHSRHFKKILFYNLYQDAFKSALTDKIGMALDAKRQTVANDWLNAGDDLEAVCEAWLGKSTAVDAAYVEQVEEVVVLV